MQFFKPTVILRHRRENLKKCSLRGLEQRADFSFFSYPQGTIPELSGYLMLALDAPPLSNADKDHGLFLLDATWCYAAKMCQYVEKHVFMEKRSIPKEFRTAYPRYQTGCPSPETGLASIEALYIAYRILERDVTGLLDTYHWKDEFLQINRHLLP